MSLALTFSGKTQSVALWAIETGINPAIIRRRLRDGWSVLKALNPKDTRGSHQRGRRWPEWVKEKISAGRRRTSLGNRRPIFVPLDLLPLADMPRYGLADCLLYADPLELLCAIEAVEHRAAS